MKIKVKYNGEGRIVWRSEKIEGWEVFLFGDKWREFDRVHPSVIEEMKNDKRVIFYEEERKEEKKVVEDKPKKKKGRKKKVEEE